MITKLKSKGPGFSLAELLITAAILGILSSIAINVTLSEIDRAKINSAQISLAGWLQVVQRSALLQKSSQINQGGCEVRFPNSFTNQVNNAEIATVIPAACAPNPSLLLDILNLGNSKISASFTSQNITFTPRGTVVSTEATPVSEIRILVDRSSLLRCIRLSGLAGVIEIGSKGAGSSLSDQCSDYTRL